MDTSTPEGGAREIAYRTRGVCNTQTFGSSGYDTQRFVARRFHLLGRGHGGKYHVLLPAAISHFIVVIAHANLPSFPTDFPPSNVVLRVGSAGARIVHLI